ncbi:NmrA/HSCARG family protein [Halococcus sp. IIIV-5B]|uniref:NmrA/HSCARG family protein n=1 Tax=Halococcus sp. IIIV-5B TaxID=2321230 RepID=UPI000E70D134|nr:NmrA/HSCARG family protein [Halococcus sp. IIIV-5B]RJS99482.1 NmrA/HSCARG family protein [Halococcus sp. IIIV-5B]
MRQQRVLVVGATGNQGGAVVDHLLSGDYGEFDVHALTRNPQGERAQRLADRGATIVTGDLLDKDDLGSAIEGVDAVYLVTTPDGGPDAETEKGRNMVDVAADADIEHFVFSSVCGVERGIGIAFFDPKYAIEQRIEELGLPTTIIRPVALMQTFEAQRRAVLGGTFTLPLAEGTPLQMVDTGDIGALTATAMAAPEAYIGETFSVAGDEHTLESAAATLTDVTGIETSANHLSIAAARDQIGDGPAQIYDWINKEGFDVDIKALESDLPIELTDFESYLYNHGWGSLGEESGN